ncbi:WD40/YVTN/BNR-like repeat-containing protein [candidate division KSB1 bacterium]
MTQLFNSKKTSVSLIVTIILLLSFQLSHAQNEQINLYRNFSWRNIGPASMAGRVSDVEALDDNYQVVLVASASGGVWKSTNAGTTWSPIFDNYGSGSIGDVAFFQKDPDIIWVGTGEANNRNSSGWGDGIYKSTDGGRSFENVGLNDTYQIARIITNPEDKNIVYVAAIGNLWGHSGSRGVFRTTDGGQTWLKLTNGLPDDGKTGCTDLIINPDNPEILYAAMYERIRKPWSFNSGGPNGGIFRSEDGGNSWTKLTNGLPLGNTGRTGLAIYLKNPEIIMANVEADENLPNDMNIPGPGVYRSEDGGNSWKYLYRHSSRPFYFGQIRINPSDDNLVYLLYRDFEISRDGGKTFGSGFRGVYGDPHAMWICPNNPNIIYFGDDGGSHLSHDAGRSWIKFDNMAIGQYYAIGVDMRDPYWVYGGLQDQNVWSVTSNSRDRTGILNDHTFNVSGGDGFHTQIDPTDWRTVYSVAHVGYVGRSNIETRERKFITPTPATIINFEEYSKPDYNETPIIYTIDPGEHWLWGDLQSRSVNGNILPPHFRFNWSSPLVISSNNPGTIYFGSNYLFRSIDRGDTWQIISPDLTTNDPKKRNPTGDGGLTVDVTGAENHCTIITISESHVNPNVIWAGTDDGNVQVTKDGGNTWTNTKYNIPDLPQEIWVSRVEASHFDAGTAYVSFDGHRSDDFNPYVYKTTDFGQNWISISDGIPDGNSVYVVKEDFKNPDLLFAGTEFSCFVTINGGKTWSKLNNNFPTVAIHDLVIHPRDGDIIAGTHGRSIWILDDITPLQQLTNSVLEQDVYLFDNRTATKWQNISRGGSRGNFIYRGQNPQQGAFIHYYLKNPPLENVGIEITDINNDFLFAQSIRGEQGINKFRWNMQFPVTESQRNELKTKLNNIIEKLLDSSIDNTQKQKLENIRLELINSTRNNDLNRIRQTLIIDFGYIAKGDEKQFGESLGRSISAPAGNYRVTLDVSGEKFYGSIIIREDPILDKNK